MTADSIISKVWPFCYTLHDDGAGYGDYLEQIIETIEAGLASFLMVAAALGK